MALLRRSYKSPGLEEETSRLNTTQAIGLTSPSSRSMSGRPQSASNVSPRRRITHLRERTVHSSRRPVSPETAARVVKDFLIPMFQADNRVSKDKFRTFTFGVEPKRQKSVGKSDFLERKQGQVYPELKLSEQLQAEVAALKAKLNTAERRAKEAEQARESLDSEVRQAMLLQTKSVSDLKLVSASVSQASKLSQSQDLIYAQLQGQVEELKRQQAESEGKSRDLSVRLREERAKTDIRLTAVISLP